jgi:hypothetical protein
MEHPSFEIAVFGRVSRLQQVLVNHLFEISQEASLARAESLPSEAFYVGGLPAADLTPLATRRPLGRPWLSSLVPRIAVKSVERTLDADLGPVIREIAWHYDRQLESWLRSKASLLVETFESQAGAFREQVRRLASRDFGSGPAMAESELERDLKQLRE